MEGALEDFSHRHPRGTLAGPGCFDPSGRPRASSSHSMLKVPSLFAAFTVAGYHSISSSQPARGASARRCRDLALPAGRCSEPGTWGPQGLLALADKVSPAPNYAQHDAYDDTGDYVSRTHDVLHHILTTA